MADEKKNEFEIFAQFNEGLAKLISEEALRLKRLSATTKAGKPKYTLGQFVLDQTKNMTKLIEAHIEAAEKSK